MKRQWFNFKEIKQAIRSILVVEYLRQGMTEPEETNRKMDALIDKILINLPLDRKRSATEYETVLEKDLKAMTVRKDEAVKFLKFWKDHSKLIQNRAMEEEFNKQINIIEVHYGVIKE